MRYRSRMKNGRKLVCEPLESRCVLSALTGGDFHAVIVAGDPNGTPADSPAGRVDPNSSTSPFAGVGSLEIDSRRGTFLCTGTPFDATHVLTAGHCVDLNNDGRSDSKDGITAIKFNLNAGSSVQIAAASWRTHPDFTGFAHPSVNDDLAVLTLASPLPAGVPFYALAPSDMTAGSTQLVMVGYGRSGDGINGYTTGASFTVKRVGGNVVDAFYGQDDGGRPAANEVFRFDFDGSSGNGPMGGPSLGNNVETTLGGGDSGGPSFVLVAGADPGLASSYVLAGVDTFTQGSAPFFGSLGGGINVFPYETWILTGAGGGGGGGGGGHGRGGSQIASASAMDTAMLAGSTLDRGSVIVSATEAGGAAATAAVSSPAAQAASTPQSSSDVPERDLLLNYAAEDQHDLSDLALASSGIADDAAPEDSSRAVDAVLRRWSV